MLKALLFSLILVCTALPQYNTMYYFYNQQSTTSSSSGSSGVTPIEPSTLSPTEWYDENEHTNVPNNEHWGDVLSANVLGDAGIADGKTDITQNGLAAWYGGAFGSYTSMFTVDASRLSILASGNSLTFFIVAKHTTDIGTRTAEYLLSVSTVVNNYSGRLAFRFANHNPSFLVGDNTNWFAATITDIDVLDGEWRIYCCQFTQATNNVTAKLWASGDKYAIGTGAAWTTRDYDTGTNGGYIFADHTLGQTEYTGIAEIIWYANIVLTEEEINGVATWLSQKWDVAW